MRRISTAICYCITLWLSGLGIAGASVSDIDYGATELFPAYSAQKVVFEFYYDQPQKIASALYWVRALYRTLGSDPYDHAPDDIKVVIVIHGTEIVTLARKNYAQYGDIVERLRYYAELGAKIHVCSQAADLFGYSAKDFPDFVSLIPAAVVDLAYWQLQGYAQITPTVVEKNFSLEEIR